MHSTRALTNFQKFKVYAESQRAKKKARGLAVPDLLHHPEPQAAFLNLIASTNQSLFLHRIRIYVNA